MPGFFGYQFYGGGGGSSGSSGSSAAGTPLAGATFWPARYWTPTYFAGRYWSGAGTAVAATGEGGTFWAARYWTPTYFAPRYWSGRAATDLLEAVLAQLQATPAIAAAFGHTPATPKLFSDQAQVGTPFPFLVLTDISEDISYESVGADSLTPETDEGELQIAIYHVGKADCRTLRRQVEATLKDAPLMISGGDVLYFRRLHRFGQIDPEPGPDGSDVWQEVVTFRTIVQRTSAAAAS